MRLQGQLKQIMKGFVSSVKESRLYPRSYGPRILRDFSKRVKQRGFGSLHLIIRLDFELIFKRHFSFGGGTHMI